MPFGPFVVARDGRAFQVKDARRVAEASEKPVLLDWEHDSEKWDGSTEAAGWGEELYVEDGVANQRPSPGVWMRTVWTEKGKRDVETKAYRFLSPVLVLDGEERDVLEIVSVALTNRPALRMEQIGKFRERLSARFGLLTADQENTMDPIKRKALCASLGLAEDASDDAILEASKKAAANRELCSTLTTQLSSAQTEHATVLATKDAKILELSTKLEAAGKSSFAADVKAAIEQGAREGKITPPSAQRWEEFCLKSPEQFAAFKENVLPNLPKLGEPAPKSVPAPATEPTASAFSEKERVELKAKGWSDDEIKKVEAHRVRLYSPPAEKED